MLLYPEGMVKLSGSAGEIMKRVDGSTSVTQIVEDLETAFPGADLRSDVIGVSGGGTWKRLDPCQAGPRSAIRSGCWRRSRTSARCTACSATTRLTTRRTARSSRPTSGCGAARGARARRDAARLLRRRAADARRPGDHGRRSAPARLLLEPHHLRRRAHREAHRRIQGRRARPHPALVPGLDAGDERLPLQHQDLRAQVEGGEADQAVRLPDGAQRRAAPA